MFSIWRFITFGCVVSLFMGSSTATPHQLYTCDFEHAASCHFGPPQGNFTWMTNSGGTPTAGTGPDYDHTKGRGHRGVYALLETSNHGGHVLHPGDNATLTGPTLTSTCPVTVTFYYLMFGWPGMGSLALSVHGHYPSWSKTGQQQSNGSTWAKATVLLKASETSGPFKIDFIGTRGKDAFGDIAFDDVLVTDDCTPTTVGHSTTATVHTTPCHSQNGTTGVLASCDFETCCTQFIQSHTDNVDWTSRHGHTQTRGTGPDNDHTRGDTTGTYLYLEASTTTGNAVRQGSTAALVSPAWTVAPGCSVHLVFFYNMYGPNVGSLQVKINGTTTDVWHRVGQQHTDGITWSKADVTFPQSVGGTTLQFDIIATRGSSYKGDIAIDDITVTQDCSGTVPTTSSKPTTSTTKQPTTTTQTTGTTTTPVPSRLLMSSCDFETTCSQFSQSHTDNVDWLVHHGHTQTVGTGPNVDHTKGDSTGTYLYLEASTTTGYAVRQGSTAALVSPALTVAPGCLVQLVFFYNMYGSSIGSLKVMIHGTTTDVWHKVGQQHTDGNTWSKAEVTFPPSVGGTTLQFDIVATRGSSYKGDIAIDDITVTQVCSGTVPTTAITPTINTTRQRTTTTQSTSTTTTPGPTTTSTATSTQSTTPAQPTTTITTPTTTTPTTTTPAQPTTTITTSTTTTPTTPPPTTTTITQPTAHTTIAATTTTTTTTTAATATTKTTTAATAATITTTTTPPSPPASPLGDGLHIHASPSAITPGLTSHLQVTCYFSANASSHIDTLWSLIVSKTTLQNPEIFTEVAAVNLYPHMKVDSYNNTEAVIRGDISAKGVSFLELEWSSPGITAGGAYECKAYGVDDKGLPKIFQDGTYVLAKTGV